ncbi:MAG: 30S ribosomal protein S12 methylthiotransferase RimO [Lachnospiraceae bacterium]|nr:30S ribosomal protein S12 methylthiotransferase RimO [Lachnospiraceae bacterium]
MNVLFISLGCDKNLVDSENMLGLLTEAGYRLVDDETQADVIVINTCCFINDAKEESIQTILEMSWHRREGCCRALLVTGCLAQRYRQEILEEIEEVDAVLGTTSFQRLTETIDQVLAGEKPGVQVDSLELLPRVQAKRLLTTGGHYAHLKIAEGCDKHCTYCIIPKIRGSYRSVPMEELLREAQELAEGGVRELILVAQETTLYGVDLYGRKMLPQLLRKLCQIQGLWWIRLQYCYPEEITEELIQTIGEEPKLCHYLDMPIQHASDRILKRMGRKTTRAQIEEKIALLRRMIPDICLRTTLITGFPGETQEEHQELLEFVDTQEFDRLGVFAYSPEEDTPAATMPDQIPEELKEERRQEIMELQQEISLDRAEKLIGKELLVMIEGQVAGENAYVARTYRDAPDVDGYLFLNTDQVLVSGDFARVRVTGALEYDLIGELNDEYESAK